MMADYVENQAAIILELRQRLSEVEAERGDLRDALVRAFGMGDGVTHDAQILAAAVDLVADQERMREAATFLTKALVGLMAAVEEADNPIDEGL